MRIVLSSDLTAVYKLVCLKLQGDEATTGKGLQLKVELYSVLKTNSHINKNSKLTPNGRTKKDKLLKEKNRLIIICLGFIWHQINKSFEIL